MQGQATREVRGHRESRRCFPRKGHLSSRWSELGRGAALSCVARAKVAAKSQAPATARLPGGRDHASLQGVGRLAAGLLLRGV